MNKTTFAVIVGNRGFFPDVLAKEGRKDILDVLAKNGYGSVALPMKTTKFGTVETLEDAKKCADLFIAKSAKIDGIIVTLPNFGDEKGITEAIRRSGLDVPVLIHAEADVPGKLSIAHRRDSFCGKISVCNNLRQAGIPYTLTNLHTVKTTSGEFAQELDDFASVCRIIKGLKNARLGAIGARTGAFNTVRYSEKLLDLFGISVQTLDLSEVLGQVSLLKDSDRSVKKKLDSIKNYVPTKTIPDEALMKMAKLGAVIDRWVRDNEINGTAIQCWTSLQQYFGVVPCCLMGMMSENLLPSACEVDVTGLLSMYILQLASGSPSAILDWNNNYGNELDKCILFHCSNIPKSFIKKPEMDYQKIIAGAVGKDNTYGTIVGRIKPAQATFCRISTDDSCGLIRAYTGEGKFTTDKVETFGGYGVMQIEDLQGLLDYICRMGFEHHVAINLCQKSRAVTEALATYMGWEIYWHS